MVNGMSNSARDGVNSNSAVVCSIFREDYGSTPEKAINFQREIEKRAFAAGRTPYFAPIITVGDFLTDKISREPLRVTPTYMGGASVTLARPETYLPDFVCQSIKGSLIAFETGESVTYGLYSAQERGTLFIGPGEKVYAGMVIGQNGKTDDIELNVCKTKHLTNTRASGSDEALRLTTPRILSLEEALDFIDTDELLEVTPKNLRIRKKTLDARMRKREKFQ